MCLTNGRLLMHIIASLISLVVLALAIGVVAMMLRGHWDKIGAALAGQDMSRQTTAVIVQIKRLDASCGKDRLSVTFSAFPSISRVRAEPLSLAA
jgi:hypothetical protein